VDTNLVVPPPLASALAMADTRARAAVESLLPHALHSHTSPTTQITDTCADLPASADSGTSAAGVPGDSSFPGRKRAGRVVHRVDFGGIRATRRSTPTNPGNHHPVQGPRLVGPPRAPLCPADGHSGTEARRAAPTHPTAVRDQLDTFARG
jgi:hypothetical protein